MPVVRSKRRSRGLRALPLHLRVCDACLPYPTVDAPPVVVEHPAVAQLRDILRGHLRDFHQRWPGAEFGKALVGNAILGALVSYGCDARTELQQAMADVQFFPSQKLDAWYERHNRA